ncbi:MAG TPA: EAL domain-containing protein [Myxococcota bacterium]|nr:EAL domain-containing protein [Myxococcota bacterium]
MSRKRERGPRTPVLPGSRVAPPSRLRGVAQQLPPGAGEPGPIDDALARALVDHASDVLAIVDSELVIRFLTPSVSRILGYEPASLLGASLVELVHPSDVPLLRGFFAEALAEPGVTPAVEWRLRTRDGRWLLFENVGTPLLDDPAVRGVALACRDVSERVRLVTQLEHLAFHDPLTNLANRALFRDRVEQALARSDRYGRGVAVLFLDLDHFKHVNDSLGHEAGDRLLAVVAERLSNCIRRVDTACRLGGDEFSVLLEGVTNDEDLLDVPHRILDSLARPIAIAGKEFVVGASIGIARAEAGDTADDVLRNADVAMYHAKSRGRGVCQVFEHYMHEAAVERLNLEADLRHALASDEFHLDFQPIVELETAHVVGVEALLRWVHASRGSVSPARFVPIAEETGLIVPLGAWVLRHACQQVAQWRRRADLHVTVNLSGRQLQDTDLVATVRAALEESSLPPDRLVLEITESVVMQNTAATLLRLRELRELGVRLAIDDFGTGYSSLAYLHRFPLDVLKVDRAFVELLARDGEDVAIAQTIVQLAHSLKLSTVAEGIEDAVQLEALLRFGCQFGQGYHFSPPVSAAAIDALLAMDGGPTAVIAAGKELPRA